MSFERYWFSMVTRAILVHRWRRRWPDEAVACPGVTRVLPCLGWKAWTSVVGR